MQVHHRVQQIEAILAEALSRGDFEVVLYDGERYLTAILADHVAVPDAIMSRPLLRLHAVAVDLERALS